MLFLETHGFDDGCHLSVLTLLCSVVLCCLWYSNNGLTIHSARAKTKSLKVSLEHRHIDSILNLWGLLWAYTARKSSKALLQDGTVAGTGNRPHLKQVQACTFLEGLGFGTKQLVCIGMICDRWSTWWIMVELCWWEKLCLQDVILRSSVCRFAGNKVASWTSFRFARYYPSVNMQPCNDLCPQQNRRLKTFQKWACNWQQGSLFGKSQIARLQLQLVDILTETDHRFRLCS